MSRHPTCSHCGSARVYRVVRYDAYACEGCGKLDEPKCDDEDCGYCSERPAEPPPRAEADH